jgi:demethylmenaquinone methyltransferase/2-methoxy-6-polyprenyl-1,4-benzoquinol methylase
VSTRDTDSVLAEQIDYYEARAPEFDDWLERLGRYDYSPAANARWHQDIVEVQDALVSAAFAGDVLELACGTGNWTEVLARAAAHATAVDASPAMITANRERLTNDGLADRVTYVQADLFTWHPDREHDAVAICFFLSHVPDDRLDPILGLVAASLRSHSRVFVADSNRAPMATTPDSPIPSPGEIRTRRRLNDGREYTIFKIFRTPAEFTAAFARHGMAFEGHETGEYFVYGFGAKES